MSGRRTGSRAPGAVLLVAAGLFGGCGGLRVPVAEPSVDLGPVPSASDGVELPAEDWWTSFGDPALDGVVERALARNLTLREAGARLAQAAADAGLAMSALYPQVGLQANRLAERRNFIGLPIPGIAADDVLTAEYVQYGLSLDLSWEANLWREATPRARAAGAGVEAAVAGVAGARVSLAGQAARLYFLALEAREQAGIAEAVAGNLEETLRWTRERARVGDAALTDVDAAAARLAEARAAAATRRRAGEAAIRSLEVLFSDYPDGEAGPDWSLGEALPADRLRVPAGIPADLIARRPDVAGAERRLAASIEFTRMARRARYPQFPLTGSAGTATARLRQLVSGDFSVWSLIARIAAPVFQGGRIRAQIRGEEARDQEALAAYARTVLTAYQEVEAALAAETALAETQSRAAQAVEASRRSLARTALERRSGFSSRLAELAAERAVLAAAAGHLAETRARLDNRVNLALALGGGFDRRDRVSAAAGGPEP